MKFLLKNQSRLNQGRPRALRFPNLSPRRLHPIRWAAVALAVLTGACGAPTVTSGKKLSVTATTSIVADAARSVGGAGVVVTGLMGPGVDPHLYKATQGDLRKLNEADVILYNGLHLEGKMTDVLENMASRVRTVCVTETMPKERLREPPEFQGNYDPHVWFDVSLWRYAVERIRDLFIEMDPGNAETYSANAARLADQMDALHAYAKEQVAAIPAKRRVLVTAHDAFGYFGEAYGMEVLGLQGISTASEYGLQDLTRLVDVIVDRRIKAVFVESSVPRKSIEALIRGAQGKGHQVVVGGELFSDALGEAGTPEGTYLGMVRHNVDTIVKALK